MNLKRLYIESQASLFMSKRLWPQVSNHTLLILKVLDIRMCIDLFCISCTAVQSVSFDMTSDGNLEVITRSIPIGVCLRTSSDKSTLASAFGPRTSQQCTGHSRTAALKVGALRAPGIVAISAWLPLLVRIQQAFFPNRRIHYSNS